MTFLEVLKTTFSATLWFSWIALLIAAVPIGITALCIGGRWSTSTADGSERKVRYVLAGFLGGLAGEFTAVSSLFLWLWWACERQDQVCHDGQAGMGLIFTLPVLSLFGSAVALAWTLASLRIPADLPWASVFRYSGPNRALNWIYAIAIPLAFWVLCVGAMTKLMFVM